MQLCLSSASRVGGRGLDWWGAGGAELVPKAMTRHSIPLSQKEMGSPGDMWGQRHVPQEASGMGQKDGLSWGYLKSQHMR